MRRRLALVVAIIAALALLPLYLRSEFWLTFWILVLLYAFLGQAWNVLGGYGGQSSFGHAAFFGTGAYATSLLQLRLGLDPWTSAALATASGALVGVAIGALSFRYGLRGSYFALVTLAFAEVFRILANSFEVFGSGSGLLIPLRLGATNFQFADRRGFFYLALGLVALSLAVALWLEHSRFGARLMALRENEEAAQALGVDVFAVKLGAIALSAALTALAGILYAQLFLYVDPGIAFGPGMSVEALLVPIIGGAGTMLGPLLGSIVLQTLGELGRQATGGAPGLGLVLQGVLLILVLAFLPDGIVGLLRRVRGRMTLRHA
jgi:branched-chain amino acid transport system permease protein